MTQLLINVGNVANDGQGTPLRTAFEYINDNFTELYSGVTTPTALANLTPVAGARAFVNNGNLVATGNFGAQIGSGGSNVIPVWSNGTNWYVG
jgi:hypothetical protein